MKPLPIAQLSSKINSIVPVIRTSVVKAVHGEAAMRKPRLDRAIVHAQLLLDELKSARLVLDQEDAA